MDLLSSLYQEPSMVELGDNRWDGPMGRRDQSRAPPSLQKYPVLRIYAIRTLR